MKITSSIAGIIAIAALIGDLVFMFVLYVLGQTVGSFSLLGDTPEVQELMQTFNFALSMGWLWAILVLITAVFAIKYALIDSRKKK